MKFLRCVMLLLVAGLLHLSEINAQYVGHRAFDNCYAGLQFGGVSPLRHHALLPDMRAVIGWHLGKQLTPAFGLELQSTLGVNTQGLHQQGSPTLFDDIHSSILAKVSLTNLIYGYLSPRRFELELVYGFGHRHFFVPASCGDDFEHLTSTAGCNLNFRLGQKKALGLTLRPHFVWNLEPQAYHAGFAEFRLTLGVTYFFKTSNGKHYMLPARLYDQPQVDALNAKIQDLRQLLQQREAELRLLKQ